MKTLKVSLKAIVFILATVMVLSTNPAAATKSTKSIADGSVVNVAHAGSLNSEPLIQLSFDNVSGEKVLISMKDENGTAVYSEMFSGKTYAKKFLFEKDLADANPVITVTYLKSNRTETYLVNRSVSTVSSLNITKL
ncbi:MAG: hypothetical protein ACM3H8_11720 [Sphingobacteriales bacterium]